ncbi:MAG: hypothetical protein ACRCS3_08360 [Paracoccaceae bacterium]
MFMIKPIVAASAMVWLTGTTAFALTADQVWKDWQANAKGVGLLLTADPATSVGGTLQLRNIRLSAETEELFRLSEMTLSENADDAVTVTLPPSFSIAPAAAEGETLEVNVTQTGFAMIVSEPQPDARAYDASAESIALTGQFVQMIDMFDGGELQPDTTEFTVNFAAMTGSYADKPGANRSFAGAFAAKTMSLKINQSGPFVGSNTQQSSVQDFSLDGTFTLPATFDLVGMENPGQMANALRDGLAVTLNFTQGKTTSVQGMVSEFLTYNVTSEAGTSRLNFSFDKTGFTMDADGEPATVQITSPEMPFPQLDLGIGASVMALKFPVIGPEVQDFRYMVKVDGITANEEAWAALDPTAVLARTPIILDLDVTGRTSLDIFGLIEAEDSGTVPPIPVVERTDIVRLLVSGAGAEVAGTGAFTFDNTAGFPMPRGNADFTVKGANKMIDALITLGAITTEDAMGARMAMALILEPTAEADVMTSKIEAREDGGFYVNGQRMR